MSMSLCYRVISNDTFDQINQGTLSFYDVSDEHDSTWDFYSMELIEAIQETGSPLFALLNVEPIWEDAVEFGVSYRSDDIASVIQAFEQTDLAELASNMGIEDATHFIQTAHAVQATFQQAQQQGKLIIGYAS